MVKGYTTHDKVGEFLQETIDGSSTPSETTVDEWIEWAEDEIDKITGFSFTSQTKTDLIMPGNGNREFWVPREYTPIISMTSLSVNTNTDFDISWSAKVENTDYFVVDESMGHLKFAPNVTGFGDKLKQIKLTFTYGYATIPYIVEELATKIVAKKFIQSKVSNTASGGNESIRVGPISINDGSKESVAFVQNLNEDINDLKGRLGSMRTYVY